MLFNSHIFILVFLPIVFSVYFYLNKNRFVIPSKIFLICSSLFFYSWWNIYYLPLIISSIIINYLIGGALSNKSKISIGGLAKKKILYLGIFLNLSFLGYFKYSNFLIQNINFIFNENLQFLDLALPLAISFFTFQQIAYLVDSYKKEVKDRDFINYATFITFFPQLIAGPIVHHKHIIPQFDSIKNKVIRYKNISLGLFIFSIGLFKKVIIADTFSIWATNGFDKVDSVTFIEAWSASLSYTFQLYYDFSGYADMAIGLALLFNIALPANFNSPYKAKNIQDFWRRWHITLSNFLRDYLYIPLGGNKEKEIKVYINIMITFILGGLWHGAAWTFLFWGALHGAALVIYKFWSKLKIQLWTWMAWLITFNFVNITWVFFRAETWNDAIKIISGMFGLSGFSIANIVVLVGRLPAPFDYIIPSSGPINFSIILLFIVIVMFSYKKFLTSLQYHKYLSILFPATLLVISLMNLGGVSEFLYFNF